MIRCRQCIEMCADFLRSMRGMNSPDNLLMAFVRSCLQAAAFSGGRSARSRGGSTSGHATAAAAAAQPKPAMSKTVGEGTVPGGLGSLGLPGAGAQGSAPSALTRRPVPSAPLSGLQGQPGQPPPAGNFFDSLLCSHLRSGCGLWRWYEVTGVAQSCLSAFISQAHEYCPVCCHHLDL